MSLTKEQEEKQNWLQHNTPFPEDENELRLIIASTYEAGIGSVNVDWDAIEKLLPNDYDSWSTIGDNLRHKLFIDIKQEVQKQLKGE